MDKTPPDDLAQLHIDRAGWSEGTTPRRRRSRWWLVLSLLTVGGGALAWASGWLSPVPTVPVTTVSRIAPSQSLSVLGATGYVVAQRKAAVSSKGTGRLEHLGIEAGQSVIKGQVLARLENQDLTAARDEVKARVAAAAAQVELARAEQNDAEANFRRMKALYERKVSPRAEYDVAETRLLKARASVNSAARNKDVAQAGLRAAEATLDYTYIRAPFDAMVLTKDADVGEVVAPFGSATSARAAVATLADMDSLMVEADVTESNIGKVAVGQPCLVTLDALPDEPQLGVVHVIMPSADRSKGTIIAKVRFNQRDPRVLPEMSAKVSFLGRPLAADERLPRLSVMKSALVERQGKTVAWRIEDNRVTPVEVGTGQALGDTVAVLSGLKDGDRVVAIPPPGLKPGDRVQAAGQ
jgi:RND family efflux transporter MFP subunit